MVYQYSNVEAGVGRQLFLSTIYMYLIIWLISTCAYSSKRQGNSNKIDMCLHTSHSTAHDHTLEHRTQLIFSSLAYLYISFIQCLINGRRLYLYQTLTGQGSIHCHAHLAHAPIRHGLRQGSDNQFTVYEYATP